MPVLSDGRGIRTYSAECQNKLYTGGKGNGQKVYHDLCEILAKRGGRYPGYVISTGNPQPEIASLINNW